MEYVFFRRQHEHYPLPLKQGTRVLIQQKSCKDLQV